MEEDEKSESKLSQSQKSNSIHSSKKNTKENFNKSQSKKNTKENFNKTQSKKNTENNSIVQEEIKLNPDDFGPLIIDKDLINKLNGSGIVEGYEYVLRKLIEANLPREKVYEKCAFFLLEYQKNILKSNVRSKQIKDFVKVAMKDAFEDENEKKDIKSPKELIPNFNIQIQSKLLLEKEEKIKQEDNKIFETNIDELLKNKIKLASKENLLKDIENRPEYGSFAAFALNENEKIRNYNFKTSTNYKKFEFIPILEVRRMMGYENNNPNNISLQNSQMFNTMGNSQINNNISFNNNFNNSQKLNEKYSENEINHAKTNSQEFVNNLIEKVSENIKESESESVSQMSQSQSQSQSQSKSVSKKMSKRPSKNSSKKSSVSNNNNEQSEQNSNA